MKNKILIATTTATLSIALLASAKFENAGDVNIRFQATGTAGMRIKGSGSTLSAKEKDGRLIITAPVTNLKTGIGLRDKHLRKYLETDKHPNASLEIARDKLKLPADQKATKARATGKFTLHGVTKPVKFTYKANRTGSDYHVQALSTIDITDFGIEQPCYLGVCVDKKVKLKVKFKLRDK